MDVIDFQLTEAYIPLIQLLKVTGMAATGGQAGMMVIEGLIRRNGEIVNEKRKKCVAGDQIECEGRIIRIVAQVTSEMKNKNVNDL